jgi:hypothetical protein
MPDIRCPIPYFKQDRTVRFQLRYLRLLSYQIRLITHNKLLPWPPMVMS